MTDKPTITLIQGDCLEYMKSMPDKSVDLVLTDPPYKGLKGGMQHIGGGVAINLRNSFSVGDIWKASYDWIPEAWRICNKGLLVFCSYHTIEEIPQTIPEAKKAGLITWDKITSAPPRNNVPYFCTEFIWAFRKNVGLDWRKLRTLLRVANLTAGCVSSRERIVNEDGVSKHPTQKPIELIKKLLAIGGDTVFDPFMGSGTTGVACKLLRRNFIGCEIDKKYFELAKRRIDSTEWGIFPKVKPDAIVNRIEFKYV